jgi:hypothetical protein
MFLSVKIAYLLIATFFFWLLVRFLLGRGSTRNDDATF